ncbi:hypothetical protein [Methylocapsa acidiphila]|uniref:hypothetical protein n=1 Tax=Methylocapsa acidiphila TaxID=133552 RepID=UPI00068498D6|nr:hypothetical protein [Methylocapsa acidiphila]
MRPQPEVIRLGEHEWLVRPLNLCQVQEIEPFLMSADGGARCSVQSAVAIVAIGLRRDHPEAARALGEIEATASDIALAMGAVLRLGGFIESEQGDKERSGGIAPGGV